MVAFISRRAMRFTAAAFLAATSSLNVHGLVVGPAAAQVAADPCGTSPVSGTNAAIVQDVTSCHPSIDLGTGSVLDSGRIILSGKDTWLIDQSGAPQSTTMSGINYYRLDKAGWTLVQTAQLTGMLPDPVTSIVDALGHVDTYALVANPDGQPPGTYLEECDAATVSGTPTPNCQTILDGPIGGGAVRYLGAAITPIAGNSGGDKMVWWTQFADSAAGGPGTVCIAYSHWLRGSYTPWDFTPSSACTKLQVGDQAFVSFQPVEIAFTRDKTQFWLFGNLQCRAGAADGPSRLGLAHGTAHKAGDGNVAALALYTNLDLDTCSAVNSEGSMQASDIWIDPSDRISLLYRAIDPNFTYIYSAPIADLLDSSAPLPRFPQQYVRGVDARFEAVVGRVLLVYDRPGEQGTLGFRCTPITSSAKPPTWMSRPEYTVDLGSYGGSHLNAIWTQSVNYQRTVPSAAMIAMVPGSAPSAAAKQGHIYSVSLDLAGRC